MPVRAIPPGAATAVRGMTERLTDAELRVAIDSLGLSDSDAAAILGVHPGQLSKWLAGRQPIPQRLTGDVKRMVGTSAEWVRWLTGHLIWSEITTVYVFRTDTDLWTVLPDTRPFTASWWTRVVGQAGHAAGLRVGVPVRIRYWSPDESAGVVS